MIAKLYILPNLNLEIQISTQFSVTESQMYYFSWAPDQVLAKYGNWTLIKPLMVNKASSSKLLTMKLVSILLN